MTLSVHGSRRIAQAGVLLTEGGRFEGNDDVMVDDGGFEGGHGAIQTPVAATGVTAAGLASMGRSSIERYN